jgi:2-polyprenyl-6-methoxyphenol hydroxylase-like FAD-dependent oxidoreductase
MTGMGTTSAMVGAYILAGELSRHCNASDGTKPTREDVLAAFKAYEDQYRPFMKQVQSGLSEGTWSYWPTSPFGIAVMNRIAGIAAALRLNVVGGWFLKEKVTGWELPEYQAFGKS